MKIDINSKIIEIATKVITHAGDARSKIIRALNAAYDGDFLKALDLINQAEIELRLAHRIQTEIIQAEARGDVVNMSLLLNHAQDTLMVAMSEMNLARQMVRLYQKLDEADDKELK